MKLGVDIGGTKIRAGHVDRARTFDVTTVNCPHESSKDSMIRIIIDLIGRLFNDKVDLIGIGVPAIVDSDGVVYDCANIPSWDRVELKSIIQSEFGVPVQINNDCNCFALGVQSSLYGRVYDDMVCMTLGTGVGSGLILDGRLYAGKNTCAGEIGCIPYLDSTFEDYCSGQFFIRRGTTAKEMAVKASLGDSDALALWAEFGKHVGNLVNTVILAYDPQLIMIGGSIANAFCFFEQSMRERMSAFPYSSVISCLKVEADPSNELMLLGAVS